MQAVNPAEMLTIYGLTLMIVGALAFQAAPQDAKAMSSIYMGNGGALISFLLAVGARDTTIERGQPGYIPMMISVHLAFIFPIIYGSAVAWRLALAWDVAAKAYLRPYFMTIVAMSVLTAVVVYLAKPKKPQPQSNHAQQRKESNIPESQEHQTAQQTPQTETIRRRRTGTAM